MMLLFKKFGFFLINRLPETVTSLVPSKAYVVTILTVLFRKDRIDTAEKVLGVAERRWPTAGELVEFRNKINELRTLNELELKVEKQNKRVLKRIRSKVASNEKVRVAFVVNDNTKWNGDGLIHEFKQYKDMQLDIVLTLSGRDKCFEAEVTSYRAEKEFFLKLNVPLIDLFDVETGKKKSLKGLGYDICFYQQPWGMRHLPRKNLGSSLALNMHYGYSVYANNKKQFRMPDFHPYLWHYFSQSELHRKIHAKYNPSIKRKLVVTGYPKLDVYYEDEPESCNIWPTSRNVKKVIYAPHHSMTQGTKISTFDWNYDLLLSMMKSNKEIDWVYKPHGKLKYVVERHGVMTKGEYADYLMEWDSAENSTVYDKGAYFDIFRTSDALVTDSGSFLGEYMLTRKPIIWLYSNDSIPLNEVGLKLSRSFYKATSRKEIVELFEEVVIRGNDWKAKEREQIIEECFPQKISASKQIVSFIRGSVGLE